MSVNRKATVPVGTSARRHRLRVVGRQCCGSSVFGPEPGRQAAQDRQPDRRVVEDEPLELPARERKAARRLERDDLGDARQAVDHGHLAEEVADAQPRELLAVANDPDGTIDDDEQTRPDLALPGDHVIGREVDLDRPFGDRGEVLRADAAEQRAAAQQRGPTILGERHGSSSDWR